jgi:Ca-activated chloride channel family protein
MIRKSLLAVAAALLVATAPLAATTGCVDIGRLTSGSTTSAPVAEDPATFRIIAASEVKTLEPIIRQYFADKGLPAPRIDYMGSVDVSNKLSAPKAKAIGYDAVWTSNPFWIELGDTSKSVKNVKTIMKSPVVFGVKESVARRLGWVGKPVLVADILRAAEDGQLKFVMSSATQSNAGAAAYLGFLYAFNGDRMLSVEDLDKPEIRDNVRRLLRQVDRTSGSPSFLNDFFVKEYDQFDAEVNYEALLIAANRGEVAGGTKLSEPLRVIYPADGMSISSSSLGLIDTGDKTKAAVFSGLQEYLLSAPVQAKVLGLGWRTGLGMNPENADKSVFNPAWGVDTTSIIAAVKLPKTEVIRKALHLYQTALRKPSFTVYCLDITGSMGDQAGDSTGIDQLKLAMHTLLDTKIAEKYYIQPSEGDVSVIMPFSDVREYPYWEATGNRPEDLAPLLSRVDVLQPGGRTDIYTPVIQAYRLIAARKDLADFSPSVIVMTDGESNTGASLSHLRSYAARLKLEQKVPVFSIEFGNANPTQLEALTGAFEGKVFDGRQDLVKAFREAKGYN